MQTICGKCRAALEVEVMAVKGTPIPTAMIAPPEPAVLKPTGPQANQPIQTAIDDDPNLLELAPIRQSPRADAARTATGGATSTAGRTLSDDDTYSLSPTAADASRPSRAAQVLRDAQHLSDVEPSIGPSSRWKHVAIAVACLTIAGICATLIWTAVLPPRANDDSDAPHSGPATKTVAK